LTLRKLDPGVAKAVKLKAFEMGMSPSDYVAWLHFDYLKRSSVDEPSDALMEDSGGEQSKQRKKKKKKR